jgi:mono/diheme cytochrome c family protein
MNIKQFSLIAAFAFVGVWGMQSCQHEQMGDPNAAICFERDILPIFNSKCAMSGCHDAGTAAEGYDLSNYSKIVGDGIVKGKPGKSEIYEEIEDGEMPPKGYTKLSDAEKQLLYDWIADGAKNGINCAVKCDSTISGFASAIQPIMTKYCVGCHSYPNASAQVELSGYIGVKNAINQGLLKSIDHSGYYPMPKGGAKLSDCEINQVRKWIQRGAPND